MRTRLLQLFDPVGRWHPAIAAEYDGSDRAAQARAEALLRLAIHFRALSR